MTNRAFALLVYWGVNVLALIVVDWLFDGVYDRGLGIAAARRRRARLRRTRS